MKKELLSEINRMKHLAGITLNEEALTRAELIQQAEPECDMQSVIDAQSQQFPETGAYGLVQIVLDNTKSAEELAQNAKDNLYPGGRYHEPTIAHLSENTELSFDDSILL